MSKKQPKPRSLVILDMILTRKGGAHRDKKRHARERRVRVAIEDD